MCYTISFGIFAKAFLKELYKGRISKKKIKKYDRFLKIALHSFG